jgi:NTE family protein
MARKSASLKSTAQKSAPLKPTARKTASLKSAANAAPIKRKSEQAAFIDAAAETTASSKAEQREPSSASTTAASRAASKKTASPAAKKSDTRNATPALPENIALVLQGGGALGAYQAGVYQGLFDAGIAPNWIAGISIGAFNTAIIAGNPPEKRMEALREFWDTISRPNVFPSTTLGQEARLTGLDADTRGWLDTWEAWRAIIEGQRGFYQPRLWLGQDPFSPPGPAAASWYDTTPMIATLNRLVDFDRLNNGGIRVSVGAVNVRTGNLEYFDNTQMRIDARHILASGALPPAFPAIEIDGEFYWDGGLVSNTPLSQVLTASPRRDTLVFQVDLWNARGELPQNLLDVAERQKEIQYSSRTRLITDTQRVLQHYRRLLRELLEEIPEDVRKNNPWTQHAAELACDRRYSVIHLIYRDKAKIGHFKDYQFGRVAMREHWVSGQSDIARALAHPEWLQLPHGESAFVAHDATAS